MRSVHKEFHKYEGRNVPLLRCKCNGELDVETAFYTAIIRLNFCTCMGTHFPK